MATTPTPERIWGLSPREKELRKQRQAKTAPLKVPKGKPIRAAVIRTRNGWRRGLRGKDKVQDKTRKVTDQMGAGYYCRNCQEWVPYRISDRHNSRCAWETEERKKYQDKQDKREREDEKNEPPARKPSKTKSEKQKQQKVPQGAGGDPMVGTGRGRRGQSNGTGGGTNGKAPMTAEAAAVIKAFEAWCNKELRTTVDLRNHLRGGDAMFALMGSMLQTFATEKIVNRKLHPVIAQPLMSAGDAISGMSHFLTSSYVAFERIYAAALEHARQQGPKPDVNDPMFSEVD